MEFILSMSFGLNLLMFVLTFNKLKGNFANIFLLILLGFVLIGTGYVILLDYTSISHGILTNIIDSTPTLVGGLTYLYIYYSIHSIKRLRIKSLIHFIPILPAVILSFFENGSSILTSIVFNIGLKIIVSIAYFIFSLRTLGNYKKMIQNHYSKTDVVDLKWLAFIVKVGLFSYLIYLSIMILWTLNVPIVANLDAYPNLIVLIFILSISYYSLSSTKVFEGISKFNSEKSQAFNSDFDNNNLKLEKSEPKELISNEKATLIFQKITSIIEEKKLYLNENLMLEDIAKELNMHSKYISYSINTTSGKSFFDFINHYRVREFNSEVLKPINKQFTYITIAYNCGFGSKSAFNRAYKNQMGISPSEYLKTQTLISVSKKT